MAFCDERKAYPRACSVVYVTQKPNGEKVWSLSTFLRRYEPARLGYSSRRRLGFHGAFWPMRDLAMEVFWQ